MNRDRAIGQQVSQRVRRLARFLSSTSLPAARVTLDVGGMLTEGIDGAIEWCGVHGIRSESLECYPGIAILERGFINVGSDPYGSGDSYFMPIDQGDDPPVFQVYHDVSDQADEILADGLLQVAVRLSDLFRQASIAGQ